jgi:hypothetical protein
VATEQPSLNYQNRSCNLDLVSTNENFSAVLCKAEAQLFSIQSMKDDSGNPVCPPPPRGAGSGGIGAGGGGIMVLLGSRGGERAGGGGGGLRIIYGSALASLVRIEEKTTHFFVTMWGVGGRREKSRTCSH